MPSLGPALSLALSFALSPAATPPPDSTLHTGLRSEGTATTRSLLGTLGPAGVGTVLVILGASADADPPVVAFVGLGIGGAGLLVGPALGHFYADQPGRGWTGIAVRTVAIGIGVAGTAYASSHLFDDDAGGQELAGIAILVGGVTLLVSAVTDIATADDSARRTNRARMGQDGWRTSIAPTFREGNPGLALTVAW